MRKKQGGKIPKNQGQNVSLNNHFIHMEYSVVENNLYGYLYAEYITNYHMYLYIPTSYYLLFLFTGLQPAFPQKAGRGRRCHKHSSREL